MLFRYWTERTKRIYSKITWFILLASMWYRSCSKRSICTLFVYFVWLHPGLAYIVDLVTFCKQCTSYSSQYNMIYPVAGTVGDMLGKFRTWCCLLFQGRTNMSSTSNLCAPLSFVITRKLTPSDYSSFPTILAEHYILQSWSFSFILRSFNRSMDSAIILYVLP